MRKIHLFLLIQILLLSSCSKNENELALNNNLKSLNTNNVLEFLPEATFLNIKYGEHEQQTFDIYLPKGRTFLNTRVLLLIHGGSWIHGDKSSLTDLALLLKESNPNHAIVNINYVLGGEDHYAFPNQFFDIEKVINHLKLNQNKYNIKLEFGLIGSSSGGHLALQYSYKYDLNNDVKFVSSLGGPTNFLDPFYENNIHSFTNLLVDKNYYQNISSLIHTDNTLSERIVKILSPLYQIKQETTPTLLIYGSEDDVVPISNATELDISLNLLNSISSLEIYDGGHGGWNSQVQIEATLEILNDFIDSHL